MIFIFTWPKAHYPIRTGNGADPKIIICQVHYEYDGHGHQKWSTLQIWSSGTNALLTSDLRVL